MKPYLQLLVTYDFLSSFSNTKFVIIHSLVATCCHSNLQGIEQKAKVR